MGAAFGGARPLQLQLLLLQERPGPTMTSPPGLAYFPPKTSLAIVANCMLDVPS